METKRIGKDARNLFVLILLYVVSRLPVILSNTATFHMSLYRGTVAKEFLQGFNLPWWQYLTDSYASASVFNGILTAPFFLLFGETMFALKLVPYVWHLFSLIVWYFVWRSCFSQRQAFFISLLFIFTAPWIIYLATSNHGTHCEMILWMGLSLLLFRRIVEGKMSVGCGGFLLGMLGGFASAVILTYLVMIPVLFFYSFLTRQKFRFYFLYAFGFLIGFSPMLYYNIFCVGWMGFDKITELYFWKSPWVEWYYLWRRFLPILFDLRDGVGGLFHFSQLDHPWDLILGYSYLYLYLLSLLFLFYRKWGFWKDLSHRLDAEAFGLIYMLLHIFLMAMGSTGYHVYYALPMVPFIGMTIVSSANALPTLWRRSILAFCILAGIIGSCLAIDWKQMGQTRHLQGFSYREMGWSMYHHFELDFDLFWKISDQFLKGRSSRIVRTFYQDVEGIEYFFYTKEEADKKLQFIRHLPESLHPLFYQKFGQQLNYLLESDPKKLEAILQKYGISKTFYPDIYRGFVLGLPHLEIGEGLCTESLRICSEAPEFTKSACYEGVGALADEDYPISKSKFRLHSKYISEIPEKYRPNYFLGVGRCFFPEWIKNSKDVNGFINSLNREELQWFYEGIRSEIEVVEDPWRQRELEKRLATSLY